MSLKPLVSIILGTRPEAIKLAPVIKVFKGSKNLDTRVIMTGQHKEMVEQVMRLFHFKSNNNLNLMRQNQSLTHITCEVLKGLHEEFEKFNPDLVLVQGDTSTAFAASLSAFYANIPVGHIEAGLRTDILNDPFPEEGNRRLISQIASLHFAPTLNSKNNLINSGVKGIIKVTGNTVIDALLSISEKTSKSSHIQNVFKKKKVIFVSIHRRENWGQRLENIINGIKLILKKHENVLIFMTVHPNPIVKDPITRSLSDNSRIILSEPLDYVELIEIIKNCSLILTDSGGLQEEAPSLGKPVLLMRETTERPEAISSGTAKLIGTDSNKILDETSYLLSNKKAYEKMSKANNPFGDGNASKYILKHCEDFLL